MGLDKLNGRVKEIGEKYKQHGIKEAKPKPKVKGIKSGRFMKRRRKNFGR